jgi:Zn finger protein HypA/HybF involved in hydrogenase expression
MEACHREGRDEDGSEVLVIHLVICKKCNWACEMTVEGNAHRWICPNCKEERAAFFDGGEVDVNAIREGLYSLKAEGNDYEIFERPW